MPSQQREVEIITLLYVLGVAFSERQGIDSDDMSLLNGRSCSEVFNAAIDIAQTME